MAQKAVKVMKDREYTEQEALVLLDRVFSFGEPCFFCGKEIDGETGVKKIGRGMYAHKKCAEKYVI